MSDAHGLLSVIPKAFHQPVGFPHDLALQKEVGVSSTLYGGSLQCTATNTVPSCTAT